MIGQQEDAVKIRKVGGKAFPDDYHWECDVCGSENCAYEQACYHCEYEEYRTQHQEQKERQELQRLKAKYERKEEQIGGSDARHL